MKMIPVEYRYKCRCHFCGTTKSVKYLVVVNDPVIDYKPSEVCCCNKCALLMRERTEGGVVPSKFKIGDTVHLSGDSAEFGLDDYNVRVNTTALVLETPKDDKEDVLVSIMEIDGDAYVNAYVRQDKLRLE